MKTPIATVSLSGTLGEKLDAIAAAKLDAVEIFENDLITFIGSPREVRRLTDQLGIGMLALQPFRDFEGMPNEHRQRRCPPCCSGTKSCRLTVAAATRS